MQDQYKKQASKSNYSQYKQKMNDEQKKAYDSSFNRNYTVNNRMNFEDAINSRPQRINVFGSRPIFVNISPSLFGGGPFSYGYGFAGPWDLWFLMRASDLFWYHHWNDITPYRNNFQQAEFNAMEQRVQNLEKQMNGVRDPNYLEPGVDPDIQFSDEYTEKNPDKIYYTEKYNAPVASPVKTIVVITLIIIVLIFMLRKAAGPRRKQRYDSRTY
ncbi:MAG: hypothetical protein K0R31_270 [Clostridiales bacterium]|jgi:hypothetical protein|nr:hypothetical protein [Clostridiales bacterium]